MFELPTNPPQEQYIYFILISSDGSVNGEIIYIPDFLNNPVLILFSAIYNEGGVAIEHFTGKTCEKMFDL
jgi:hypothetical protein